MSTTSAIACTLGWEPSELLEYRYHAGRGTRSVYTVDDLYMCGGKKAPTANQLPHLAGLVWEKYPDQFWAEKANTTIWQASAKN